MDDFYNESIESKEILDLTDTLKELIFIENDRLQLENEKIELEDKRQENFDSYFESLDENFSGIIDYTKNLELVEEQLIILNENVIEGYSSIITNSINTLEITIIFVGVFIGILLSFVFGVVAFND